MFTLARDLGMTRGDLGRRMSARELTHWKALYRVEALERDEAEEKARQQGRRR